MKIGIIDDGLDQSHPFFNPAGFTMPAGFPKGNTAYTTPKVIVARAFAPAEPDVEVRATRRSTRSTRSTRRTSPASPPATTARSRTARAARSRVSGVAPDAYLGNYKVLTVPTDRRRPRRQRAGDRAGSRRPCKDGMDVINLSLGEPEIEPSRDIVVTGARRTPPTPGVVPVVAAGNDFDDSAAAPSAPPGSAPQAITAAAVDDGTEARRRIASFSSGGPTPVSLQLKPDVTAPGVDILSSVPRATAWDVFSGTSMASPHVAGAAALLRQRHPTWTVAQIKSALEHDRRSGARAEHAERGVRRRARAAV